MADLLPSLSSDEEGRPNQVEGDDDENSLEEVNVDFNFEGIMGEDGMPGAAFTGEKTSTSWSYKDTLKILKKNDAMGSRPERMNVTSLIEAARSNIKKKSHDKRSTLVNRSTEIRPGETESRVLSRSEDEDEDREVDDVEESDEDDVDNALAAKEHMVADILTLRTREASSTYNDHGHGDGDGAGNEEEEEDPDALLEAEKARAFFEEAKDSSSDEIQVFAQLNLSRPLLRGVASMGFVTPTPIQARVIPIALAGKDVCASAVTGSGKTAAFLLPVMERILQRSSGNAVIKGLILTPTRELAAQCLGMMTAIAKFTNLRFTLIVGGAKNISSQAAELRARPDIVVATPGRLLDHITNSPGVVIDDVEFLVLDEADRLLDLGFQEEVHEVIKSCPTQRQTLLFSATMNTKVDELVKLSLKSTVRVRVSAKNRKGLDDSVEVAPRLQQEFVRVRSGNEGIKREAMFLALLTRTYTKRTIAFFDMKATAHRLMILAGLCGIKCAELHGNLTQTQRLQALEDFREGNVDILLATDLAARGLDLPSVRSVVNFEMPKQIESYVHRIGRTARAGRGGKSCTMIGEGRRHFMKDVIKDADEKAKLGGLGGGNGGPESVSGIIRSRTIPPAVVAHFVAKINSLQPHVEEVLAAEAVARMDCLAEMETDRAKNIIEHADEIKSRPKREWFASNKEKEATREAVAAKQKLIAEKAGSGMHRMTRKKRRAREAKEVFLGFQQEKQRENEESGVRTKKVISDTSIKTAARAQKKLEALKEKEREKKSINDESRARELKEKVKAANKAEKEKGVFARDTLGDRCLYENEKVTYATRREKEDRPAKSSYEFTEFDPSKRKRKGGKQGVSSFKSKKKFKRR